MTVDVAATGSRATVERQGSFGILPGTLATPLALVLSTLSLWLTLQVTG